MPMERINSYRARKQREVDREMAARETRVGGGLGCGAAPTCALCSASARAGCGLGRAIVHQSCSTYGWHPCFVCPMHTLPLLSDPDPPLLLPLPLPQVNLQAAVREQGFVVQESEVALLQRGGSPEAAPGSPQRRSSARSSSGSGARWVSHLQALSSSIGSGVKDSIDRGRMRIAHRRAQSLGATAYEAPSP